MPPIRLRAPAAALRYAPHVRRAPALVQLRDAWVPGTACGDGPAPWLLAGASLAVWAGEIVCVAGADAAALDALLTALRAGAPPVTVRGSDMRARAQADVRVVLLPARPRLTPAARVKGAVARLPPSGAVVCALAVPEDPSAWASLVAATAIAARRAPCRLVWLAAGRVRPPPRSVDPFPGRS